MDNKERETRRIEDELEKNGVLVTNTKGKSMCPLLKPHCDAVVLKRVDKEIKKYDVVLYRDFAGRYVLHRVVAKRDDVFIIRGDNTFKKEFIPQNDILAYMVSFNRKGKRHTTDGFGYRFYSRFWNFIYPIRFLWRKFRSLLGKIKRKILK